MTALEREMIIHHHPSGVRASFVNCEFNLVVRNYLLELVKHTMLFSNVILTVMVTGKSMPIWKNSLDIMKQLSRYE